MTVKNVLSLSLFWLLLNSSAGFGASFENNVLFIPVVTVGPDAYSLELLLNQDGPDIDFSVVGAQEIQVLDTSGASSFDGTNLFVPKLSIDSLNYSLTLSLVNIDPPKFRLKDYAKLTENSAVMGQWVFNLDLQGQKSSINLTITENEGKLGGTWVALQGAYTLSDVSFVGDTLSFFLETLQGSRTVSFELKDSLLIGSLSTPRGEQQIVGRKSS